MIQLLHGPSKKEGTNRSGPAALRAREVLEQANSGSSPHSEGQHGVASLETGIAALQASALHGINKPSPFEVHCSCCTVILLLDVCACFESVLTITVCTSRTGGVSTLDCMSLTVCARPVKLA